MFGQGFRGQWRYVNRLKLQNSRHPTQLSAVCAIDTMAHRWRVSAAFHCRALTGGAANARASNGVHHLRSHPGKGASRSRNDRVDDMGVGTGGPVGRALKLDVPGGAGNASFPEVEVTSGAVAKVTSRAEQGNCNFDFSRTWLRGCPGRPRMSGKG